MAQTKALTQKKKKIIFINRFFYPDHSATSQILSDLAFDAATEFDVTVITSRLIYDDPSARLQSSERIGGVNVKRVWSSRFGRGNIAGRAIDYISFYFTAASALWRLAIPGTVVVSKTDPPLISIVVAPVAKLRRAPLVNWLQDLFPEVASALNLRAVPRPVAALLRRLRNASLHTAQANVVLGTRMQKLLLDEGVPPSRIRIIHNWADGQEITPVVNSENPFRRAWGLERKFVVGYSGNLGRAHDFATILGAAESLRENPDIVFLFIGDGAQRAWVEAETQSRRLTNIRFRPYQPRERLAQSLSLPDVHLVSLNPSLEGLIVPSKIYGIAAAGRPVLFIGDPNGEIALLVQELESGLSIPVGASQDLAEVILLLSKNPAQCEMMGRRARTLFVSRFDRSKAVEKWLNLLRAC